MYCPPPKLSKLLRLYGPAYLHAGASISPNNHGASPILTTPPFSAMPHPTHPTPQTIFGHFIRNFVQFMRVFSELWKLAVRDNDQKMKNIYKWGW